MGPWVPCSAAVLLLFWAEVVADRNFKAMELVSNFAAGGESDHIMSDETMFEGNPTPDPAKLLPQNSSTPKK